MPKPTTYDSKYLKEIDVYLGKCQDAIVNQNNREIIKVNLPTVYGFCKHIGVAQRTVYDWRDEFPEFKEELAKIVREQKQRLIDNGLAGTYNPTIAKLMLSSNHGMREKTESDLTSKGQPLSFNIVYGNNKPAND